MKTFSVDWCKTYVRTGTLIVKAELKDEAEDMVDAMIGDLEGSLQYLPGDNQITVFETGSDH
jgi:hypothetical protein